MKRAALLLLALLALAGPALAYVEYPSPGGSVGAGVTMSLDGSGNAVASGIARATANTTVTTGAYAIGSVIGAKMTFAALPSTGWVSKITVTMADAQLVTLDILLFSQPITSTITDRTNPALLAADQANYIGTVHLSDCNTYTTPTLCQALPNIAYALPSGTSIYGVIVARSAANPTPSALTWSLALVAVR